MKNAMFTAHYAAQNAGGGIRLAAETHRINKLIIKPEYLELVPRLSDEDRNNLKESLKKDGQLLPITVNPQGIILDGHTRYAICTELGIHPVRFKVVQFQTMEDEMRFVVMTNLARRQLSKFQRVELAWPLYELEKKRALEREAWKTNKDLCVIDKKTGKIVKAKKPIKEGLSSIVFGKKIGVGKTLIAQVEWLRNNAPQEVLQKCRTGKMSTVAAYDMVRGQKMMSDGKKPETPIKFCPQCNTETTSSKKTGCHVHRWFCCSHCKWGV
jgi:hypothetical protein